MGDPSMGIDMAKIISYCDDSSRFVKDRRDSELVKQCLGDLKNLKTSCDTDLGMVKSAIQDYESKIDACKKKTEAAKLEVVSDEELDLLLKELEEEQKKESLLLEELRGITNETNDKERTRISVRERKQTLKRLEQDELNAQKTLSMLASVTNIIPDLSQPSKVSGHVVDRDKKVAKKFEFDSTQRTDFDTCDGIWKMIGL